MKTTVCLLLSCLATACIAYPMRDGSKDPSEMETSSDAASVPTEISFQDITSPNPLVLNDGDSDEWVRRRHQRDAETLPPTPSEELASTTPLIIKGGVDHDVEPPTPSEELANTTPLIIKDGNPDQWQMRLRRNEHRVPPTVALQPDFNGTEEESVETTPTAHNSESSRLRRSVHFMKNANLHRKDFLNEKPNAVEEVEDEQRYRRAVQDVIPDLGMPVLKSNEQMEKIGARVPPFEGKQLEGIGMPILKENATDELPKTEDESGWSSPRRFVDSNPDQDGQTAEEQQDVEIPEAASTAPLIIDRLQIESEAQELAKEQPELTVTAGAATEDKQEEADASEETSTPHRTMDRAADEVRELTTETPKLDDEVRRRRSTRKHWVEEPKPADDGQVTTESPLEEEPFSTEERRKRSEDGHDRDRIEEIEEILAGEKNMSTLAKEHDARIQRSTDSDDQGQGKVHHKMPGVAAVEEAGLAATLEQQIAHAQGKDGSQTVSTGRQMQTEEDEKNERRRRRSTHIQAVVEVPEVDKKEEETVASGSEVETRTRDAGTEKEAESTKGENWTEENKEAEAGTRWRRSVSEESEDSRGEAPAGGTSAGRIEPENDSVKADETGEEVLHSTPDTIGDGFYDTDCKGRVFC